jgi:hypothetical protein
LDDCKQQKLFPLPFSCKYGETPQLDEIGLAVLRRATSYYDNGISQGPLRKLGKKTWPRNAEAPRRFRRGASVLAPGGELADSGFMLPSLFGEEKR